MESNLKLLLSSKNILLDNIYADMEEICFINDSHFLPIQPTGLSPEEFLAQAENDFDIGGQTALLNSITNAKRAIQCQIDQWILALGIGTTKKKKIEILNQIGFAPRIFKKSWIREIF